MFSGLSLIKILAWFLVYFIVGKIFFARKYFNEIVQHKKIINEKKTLKWKRYHTWTYMNFWPQLISFSLQFLVHCHLKIVNIFLKLFTLNISRPFLSQWKPVILMVHLSKNCKLMLWTCPRKLKQMTNGLLDFSSLQSFFITQINFLSILSYTLLFCQ